MTIYAAEEAAAAAHLVDVIPAEKTRNAVAKYLVAAANCGAGDALAGMLLQGVPKEHALRIAELLEIELPDRIYLSPQSFAISLMSMKSKNQKVRKLLRAIRMCSLTGSGVRISDLENLSDEE